jgi:hypothetical protein
MIRKIVNKIKDDCREFITARKRIALLDKQLKIEKERSLQYFESCCELQVVISRYFSTSRKKCE